jgi:hypothetical protein
MQFPPEHSLISPIPLFADKTTWILTQLDRGRASSKVFGEKLFLLGFVFRTGDKGEKTHSDIATKCMSAKWHHK